MFDIQIQWCPECHWESVGISDIFSLDGFLSRRDRKTRCPECDYFPLLDVKKAA